MYGWCLIISGAPDCFVPMSYNRAEYVIACDRGYMHAVRAKIVPNLVIGDFDSYDGIIPPGIEILKYPAEKDDTDTMIALKKGLSLGYRQFILIGAMGGRKDHELANMALSVYAAENDAICHIVDAHHQIFAVKNRTMNVDRSCWNRVSIFAADRTVKGVTLKGFKYNLQDAELSNFYPLGTSNEFTEDTAEISVKDGTLLVVLTDME